MQNAAVHAAMEYAYKSEGIRSFTQVNGMYTCGAQHSAKRTKDIMERAQAYLNRHAVAHTLSVVRCQSGEAMHFIH